MLRKLFLPKQEDFFQFFQSIVVELVEAAVQFELLLKDLSHAEQYGQIIANHEKTADKIADATLARLHKTFITPFDRNDIHRLVKKLDDILDATNRTSKRIIIYKIESIPTEITSMSHLCVKAVLAIQKAVNLLNNLKKSEEILSLCASVNDIESETEQLLLSGVSRLFQETSDHRMLLKTKEIYEYTNGIIKKCQGVAHIIKDVVLEYS